MLGLEFAPIDVEIAPDQTSWRVVIPGLVRVAAKALSGPTSEGKPPRMENLPGSETGPGQIGTQGKATEDNVNAFAYKWDRVGTAPVEGDVLARVPSAIPIEGEGVNIVLRCLALSADLSGSRLGPWKVLHPRRLAFARWA